MKRSFFLTSAALVAATVIPTEEAQRFWALGAAPAQAPRARMIQYFAENESGILIPHLVPYSRDKIAWLIGSGMPLGLTGFKVLNA